VSFYPILYTGESNFDERNGQLPGFHSERSNFLQNRHFNTNHAILKKTSVI